MIFAVINAIYAIAYIEVGKIQDFNGVWTHDLPIPVWPSNQLSYEATDIGSWSFVGAREEWMLKLYMKYFIYWTVHVKSIKLWSSQLLTQFIFIPHERIRTHKMTSS